jgi:hypothetical protein
MHAALVTGGALLLLLSKVVFGRVLTPTTRLEKEGLLF